MRLEPPFVLPPRAEAVLSRIRLDRAVLVLACVPMLMGPPIAAIALALCFRHSRNVGAEPARINTGLVIAIANIVLSIVLWRHLVTHVGSSALDVLETLKNHPLGILSPNGSQKI